MYNLSFPTRTSSIFDLIDRPFDFMSEHDSHKYSTESTETDYKIRISLPGHDKESVKLSFESGKLLISARCPEEVKDSLFRSESFKFILPKNCNPDQIDAQMSNGILTVSIAKFVEKKQAKRIEIAVS